VPRFLLGFVDLKKKAIRREKEDSPFFVAVSRRSQEFGDSPT
jgi:hypothetical protein